ncbi:DNA polymerase subunit Cdc27-domain-containing protein [Mycena metata]|uniref:DNA polymerase delta subunit 3 n=1 Tax=Mycena metata TaxID=1033252 RepID=A0AAD7K304_9AGAR|nr:DNA polymerase subunit Cdc27-domain-containing protein [Mycena metata]
MSTQPIRDYLTKQLLIDKNIVTYRSLSRVMALNVNIAKNELATFHAADGQNLAATYLLSGETLAAQKRLDEDIDMDDDEDEDGEYVPQTEILLVGEKELESVQAQFATLESFHVYSLSPSVIRASPSPYVYAPPLLIARQDAGLLCTPTEIVRELDKTEGAELATVVGKVVGADVNVSTKTQPGWAGRKAPPAPVAGSSKTPAAGTSTVKKEEDAKPKEKAKPEKPKATGKLDFSKAKTKPVKKEEEKKEKPVKAETKRKAESRAPSVASTIGEKVQVKMEESKSAKGKSALISDSEDEVAAKPAARGVKRKSALPSDSEDEVKPTKPAKPVVQPQSSVRVRKGVVLSDNEDDAPAPARKGKGKAKATAVASDSEAEKNLRAMMDIDDDAVTRVSRDARESEPDDPMEAVDAEMSDGESKPAPVKRKPKKVIPVGKNGLKKKRIVKSKTRIDEKGYMVTEDFSEYESVDEEEEEPAPPPKTKAKAKAKSTTGDAAPAKAKPAPKPAPAKAKPKPSGSSKGAQQTGLASFFGKSKSK